MSKKKKVGIYVDPDLWRRLRLVAAHCGKSHSWAVERALEHWFQLAEMVTLTPKAPYVPDPISQDVTRIFATKPIANNAYSDVKELATEPDEFSQAPPRKPR